MEFLLFWKVRNNFYTEIQADYLKPVFLYKV